MPSANDTNRDSEALLPFYVYVLIDPTNNQIFYVGKGKNKRLNHHWNEIKSKLGNSLSEGNPKKEILQRIQEEGKKPLQLVIGRYKLESEAFCVEATLINWVYGFVNLSNQNRGKGAHLIRPRGVFDKLLNIDIPRSGRINNDMTQVELDDFFRQRSRQKNNVIEFSRFVFYTVENILLKTHPKQMVLANLTPAIRSTRSRITHFLDSIDRPFPLAKRTLPKVIFKNRLGDRTSRDRLHVEIAKNKNTTFESIFRHLVLDHAARSEFCNWKIEESSTRYELLLPLAANPELIKSILVLGINHAVHAVLDDGNRSR